MLTIGLLYMVYKAYSDVMAEGPRNNIDKQDTIAATIFGAQTGLVALAMIVTRSCVLPLRARVRLVSGNLYVRCFTLCKSSGHSNFHPANTSSGIFVSSIDIPSRCQ